MTMHPSSANIRATKLFPLPIPPTSPMMGLPANNASGILTESRASEMFGLTKPPPHLLNPVVSVRPQFFFGCDRFFWLYASPSRDKLAKPRQQRRTHAHSRY